MKAIFRVTPLNWVEWKAVFYFSIPVILLDEVLKFVTRNFIQTAVEADTGMLCLFNLFIRLFTLEFQWTVSGRLAAPQKL